jgi:hypothetical protein
MSAKSDFAIGIAASLAGVVLLLNLNAAAKFDQRSGAMINAWLKGRLGKSSLSQDVWSVGTPAGMRGSKLGFAVAGTALLLIGLALQITWILRLVPR